MHFKKIPEAVLEELNYLICDRDPLELSIFLRKMHFSYLRELSESGVPENFESETLMAEQLFMVFETAIREKLKS